MVKPGGTGRPRLAISARFAPLPPSSSRIALLPSARPSPNVNTHLPDGTEARCTGFGFDLATAFDSGLRPAGAFLAEVFAAAGFERGREADFDEALAMMSGAVQGTGSRLQHAFMLRCKRGEPPFTATLCGMRVLTLISGCRDRGYRRRSGRS